MFIRFAIPCRDLRSQVEMGLIHAASLYLRAGWLSHQDEERVQEFLTWFNCRLPVPKRFARSRRPRACKRAISWFRPTSRACLERIQDLAELLLTNCYLVERISIDRPGYVVYEDEHQVVAEVFRREYHVRRSTTTIWEPGFERV